MKIYKDPGSDLAQTHCWFYGYDPAWTVVTDFTQADIVPLIADVRLNHDLTWYQANYQPNQVLLIMDVTHASEEFGPRYIDHVVHELASITDKFIIVHTNANTQAMAGSDPRMVYWDCMFNRQKLYFTYYSGVKGLGPQVWSENTHQGTFALSNELRYTTKKFLSPMRVYYEQDQGIRMSMRRRLRDHLAQYSDQGLISCPEQGQTFLPEACTGLSLSNILNNTAGTGGLWEPIANCYYDVTAASIYVETIVQGQSMNIISEKTWDPLIKRHFILPFAYPGMLRQLQEDYGVRLPDFIDYSYDSIQDLEQRFAAYLNSVDQFLSLSTAELAQHVHNHESLFEHNRSLFFTRDYDSLYKKVRDRCRLLGYDIS